MLLGLYQRVMNMARESLAYALPNMRIVVILAVFTVIMFYFLFDLVFQQPYENIGLRLLIALLFLPLLLFSPKSKHIPNWQIAYWLLLNWLALSVFFHFMLLMNQLNHIWSLAQVSGLLLLILFISDGVLLFLVVVSGFAFAWLLFVWLGECCYVLFWHEYAALMVLYMFMLLCGSFLNHSRQAVRSQQLRAVAFAGENIAHELRTPLATIKANMQGVQRFLPELLLAYDKAKQADLVSSHIRQSQFYALSQAADSVTREVTHAQVVIDMLLQNSDSDLVDRAQLTRLTVTEVVEEAIGRYPYKSETEQQSITIALEDSFTLRAERALLVNVLFNLLRNALYATAGVERAASISLYSRSGSQFNYIYVEDNGPGIAPGHLPHIFERFYSTAPVGIGNGIGLSFCKMVMRRLGGDIRCQSELGKYTRFILKFPKLSRDAEVPLDQ